MHILKYYIKRCIGLPGDTLSIRDGIFQINGMEEQLGNLDSQRKIGQTLPDELYLISQTDRMGTEKKTRIPGFYDLIGRETLESYCFQKNYYFMAGDKGMNSQDSRYWGLLPEEYIVGKATFIWKSVDPYTGKFRWDRFLKKIE